MAGPAPRRCFEGEVPSFEAFFPRRRGRLQTHTIYTHTRYTTHTRPLPWAWQRPQACGLRQGRAQAGRSQTLGHRAPHQQRGAPATGLTPGWGVPQRPRGCPPALPAATPPSIPPFPSGGTAPCGPPWKPLPTPPPRRLSSAPAPPL